MPKLRKLRFATLDDAIADIERLRSGPYQRGGAWSLTQCSDHLANTIDVGLNGGLEPLFPWLLRATVIRAAFEAVLLTERMPSGAPAPLLGYSGAGLLPFRHLRGRGKDTGEAWGTLTRSLRVQPQADRARRWAAR